MNNRTKVSCINITICIGLLIFTACCKPADRSLKQPNTFTNRYRQITSESINLIVEIKQLSENSPKIIGAIGYNHESNAAMIVNMDTGNMETWSLDNDSLVSTLILQIVTDQGLNFNGNANEILGANNHEYRDDNKDGFLEEYIYGIKAWDTSDGTVIYCFVNCDYIPPLATYISSGLNITGDWIYIFSTGDMMSENIKSGQSNNVILLSPDNYFHLISNLTLNSTGNRYAIAYQEGGVRIFSQKIVALFSPEFERNIDNDFKAAIALTFSPSDRWLARIRDDKVNIWRVIGLTGKEQYEVEIPSAKLLVFDNMEQMLFVSSEDTITVIDITKKDIVTTLSTPNITALSISQDNRLLLWGDSEGIIHIWGVEQ